MQVRYNITVAEWREAIRVYQSKRRRPIVNGLIWVCILIPLIGAFIETAIEWRPGQTNIYASVGPLLVVLICLTAMVAYGMHLWQRDRTPIARGIPVGEHEMTLYENGVVRTACSGGVPGEVPIAEYGWEQFSEMRLGPKVMVLILADDAGFEAIPLRVFTAEQLEWTKRLVSRKVRPQRQVEESRTGLPPFMG